MGFRFRKSVKIAPGVRLNLGKKGASVSVGKRGARVTVGKTGVRSTVGVPGTGLSYTKHHFFKNKKSSKQSRSYNATMVNNTNDNKPIQQVDPFNIIKWAFYVFLAFVIIMMAKDSPNVWFGVLILVLSAVLKMLSKKEIINFKKTWIITSLGWFLVFILWMSGISPKTPIENPTLNESDTIIFSPLEKENIESSNLTDPSKNETNVVEEHSENENEVSSDGAGETENIGNNIQIDSTNQQPSESITQTVNPAVQQEYFPNCKEMNKVYPNGVSKDHPAYDPARDRDKDGWACE